jgi:hypothetical protein
MTKSRRIKQTPDGVELPVLPARDNGQVALFSALEADWQAEWWGMPEFVMGSRNPVQQIVISFLSREDVEAFAKLIGQRLTPTTSSLWYPEQADDYLMPSELVYVDA